MDYINIFFLIVVFLCLAVNREGKEMVAGWNMHEAVLFLNRCFRIVIGGEGQSVSDMVFLCTFPTGFLRKVKRRAQSQ